MRRLMLWSGHVAPTYAADVPIAGVIGIAPATDLPRLADRIQHTAIGRVGTRLKEILQSATETSTVGCGGTA